MYKFKIPNKVNNVINYSPQHTNDNITICYSRENQYYQAIHNLDNIEEIVDDLKYDMTIPANSNIVVDEDGEKMRVSSGVDPQFLVVFNKGKSFFYLDWIGLKELMLSIVLNVAFKYEFINTYNVDGSVIDRKVQIERIYNQKLTNVLNVTFDNNIPISIKITPELITHFEKLMKILPPNRGPLKYTEYN